MQIFNGISFSSLYSDARAVDFETDTVIMAKQELLKSIFRATLKNTNPNLLVKTDKRCSIVRQIYESHRKRITHWVSKENPITYDDEYFELIKEQKIKDLYDTHIQ